MSRVTVLCGSMRKNGNTELLVQEFVKGAKIHNEVEVISVADYRIEPCSGCNYCRMNKESTCCLKDDMNAVYDKLLETQVLVVASPLYFYGVSARLKAIIDRLHNPVRKSFKIKKTVLLSVAADSIPELFDALITQYKLCVSYFGFEDLGTVLVRGVEEKGAIKGNPALIKAYELGLSVR